MPWLVPSVIATMAGTVILAITYYYLYLQDRKSYLAIWTMSWSVYFFRFIFMLWMIIGHKNSILLISNQISSLISSMLLLWGTYHFIDKKFSRLWVYAAAITATWLIVSILLELPFLFISFPTFTFMAIIYIWTGLLFFRSKTTERTERAITGGAFIVWGIHKADYPFVRPVIWLAPWGYLLGAMLEFIVALGMLMVYFQKTRNELRKNEEKYRRLTENAKDMIYRMSIPDGNYEYVSPASTDVFGYTPEEFYESSLLIRKIIHPDWIDYFKEQWANLLAGKMPPSYEYQIIHKSGEERWLHQRNVLICDSNDQPVAIEGIVTDITDRKLAEKEGHYYHERLLTVLESIDATIYVSDLETHEILFMNKRMIQDFGGDYTGKICWQVFREGSMPCAHCTNDKLFDDKGEPVGVCVWQDYNPVVGKWYNNYDRAIKWVDSRYVKLQIATDITEFKHMEDELRQAHKMESIGTLVGGIAHDFNNMLYMIVGNAELALDDIPKWNPVYTTLEEIKSAGLRAAGIVKQLLNFSRKTDQEFRPIGVVPVIKDVLKFLRSTIPATIEIRNHMPDVDIIIFADPIQINQVLMNLCTNASQAMEDNGGILDVNVETTIIEEGNQKGIELPAGKYLKITVSDTGPGIAAEILGRIFDPYFTTKETGKGSGLGLSIVHGIVKNHDGAIFVDSKFGKGTTFTILFPAVDEKPEDEVEIIEKFPLGTETILFIDDEAPIMDMTKKILEKLGYQVEARLDPVEALALFQSKPDSFDLVITDMTMPLMTGVKLSENLMKIRPDISVIICTGHSSLIDEEEAKQLGIAGYVMKPVSMLEIAKAVRKALDR